MMRKQIIPGFEPWRKVVKEKQPDPNCRICGGTGWEDYGEPIWDSWVCSNCMTEEEPEMGQDVLRSYHEDLVARLREIGQSVEWYAMGDADKKFYVLVSEIQAALAAGRDQNRSAGQPLQEKSAKPTN